MNKSFPQNRLRTINGPNGSNGVNRFNGSHRAKNGNGHAANGIGLTAPIATLEHARELTSLVLALARQLLAVDDKAAELPLRQLRVCMVLHEGPRPMSALSRELGVSLSAMTQIADRLERAGLVKRSLGGTDRRVRSLQLTPRGQKMMRLREQTRIQRVSGVVERMSHETTKEVLAALNVLLEACSTAKG